MVLQLPDGATCATGLPLYALPVLILLYNFWLKKTLLGPIAMGLCRGFNLLLGTIIAEPEAICYIAAGVSTLYITGVTIIAHDETRQGTSWQYADSSTGLIPPTACC